MNVELSPKEYLDLLDLLHMASWVLVAHKTEPDPRIEKYDRIIQKFYALAKDMGPDPRIEKYDRIIQKFYALAKDMGHAGLAKYDPGRAKYHPTTSFEDTSRYLEFIDEFVDHSFWDELIVRFAERDAARQSGGYEKLDQLGHEDRHALVDSFEKRYAEEFNERGIERLEIVERFGDALKPAATHD